MTNVRLATTQPKNVVDDIQALAGNPYDGHPLIGQLDQVERLTGYRPCCCVVDQGYRGQGSKIRDQSLGKSITLLDPPNSDAALRRRNNLEPLIGHLKEDGVLGGNFFKGAEGDKLNASLCGGPKPQGNSQAAEKFFVPN